MTQAPPPPPVVEPAPVVSAEPVPPVSIQPTTTIGPATYPAPTDYAPSGGGTYTIRKGDTLFSIAKRTYGSGNRWRDIVAANPGLVPEKLRVGQTITLP
ncbi:MAG: LysM peptidoglycan-binding domain-containing protein [Phycisphaera sp.]|nr:LysM peptidoglycan-binding domain-containing protein [Phycisphaera sp.]